MISETCDAFIEFKWQYYWIAGGPVLYVVFKV